MPNRRPEDPPPQHESAGRPDVNPSPATAQETRSAENLSLAEGQRLGERALQSATFQAELKRDLENHDSEQSKRMMSDTMYRQGFMEIITKNQHMLKPGDLTDFTTLTTYGKLNPSPSSPLK